MEVEALDKETHCPKCDQVINFNVKSEDISCNNCKKNFMYKFCPECNQIIFFNKIEYDGYNIVCPYISCHSMTSSVKCPKCNKKIFSNSKYKYFQGDEVECKECNFSFKKVKCPKLDCQKNIELPPDFIDGGQIKCEHGGISTPLYFQKLGCWYCGRHCVWNNSEGKIYIEGQEIQCPYKECGNITNKITCPKCRKTSTIIKANLEMGKKINCLMKNCNCTYNIYFCPFCKKSGYGDGTPLAGNNITCKNCDKSFYFVNCFYCKQINFWKEPSKYIPCQTILCNNEYCNKKSALIQCPFCGKVNHFTKGVFALGKEYQCSYGGCKKDFIILYCGNCNMTQIKSPTLSPDILFTCDLCKKYMPTVQCPSCFKFCSPYNDIKLKNNSIIKCPYSSCGKIFYYYICPFCKHDFNSNTYSSLNIKCPFKKCNKSFSYFICKNCQRENYKRSDENKMEIDSEEMTCENCGAKNIISNSPENNIYIEMKKANIVQGEKYIFDKPEEDPYDRLIIDNLIKTKIYDIIINKKNNEDEENKDNKVCVICMVNPIEWILAPCGHKCLCSGPNCGQIYKNDKTKNCPICKEKIIGILERVIDD